MTEQAPETPAEAQTPAGPPPREPIFNLPRIVVGFIALCTIIHFARLFALDPVQDMEILLRTAFIPIRYAFPLDIYGFTTPLTYSLLHGNIPHLLINMTWLAAFGSPLANRLGVVRFVLFWAATSIAAAALHYGLHMMDESPLVGASGAISGMMGAAARFGFRIDRSSGQGAFGGPILPMGAVLRSRGVMTFLIVWFVVNLATGLAGFVPGVEGQIAWEAHIGGFLVGFLFIGLFDPPGRAPIRRHNGMAERNGGDAAG